MNRINLLILGIFGLLLQPGIAFADILPEGGGRGLVIFIFPLATLLYLLSGTASYYDNKMPPGAKLGRWKIWVLVGAGLLCLILFLLFDSLDSFSLLVAPFLAIYAVMLGLLCKQRLLALVVSLVVSSFSIIAPAGHFVSPIFAGYALVLGIRMLRVQKNIGHPVATFIPRVAGVLLIPLAFFLAGFDLAYRYSPFFNVNEGTRIIAPLLKFVRYQAENAKTHGGMYHKLDLIQHETDAYIEMPDKSTAFIYGCGEALKCTLTYGQNLRTYTFRATPLKLLPWPYNYLSLYVSPIKAYYLDQTGIIRYENVAETTKEASATSPILHVVDRQ